MEFTIKPGEFSRRAISASDAAGSGIANPAALGLDWVMHAIPVRSEPPPASSAYPALARAAGG